MTLALALIAGLLAGILHKLHQIFLEVRSVRLMMNDDRKIPNEFS